MDGTWEQTPMTILWPPYIPAHTHTNIRKSLVVFLFWKMYQLHSIKYWLSHAIRYKRRWQGHIFSFRMTKASVWPGTIGVRLREKTNTRPTCPLEGEGDSLKVKAHRMTAADGCQSPHRHREDLRNTRWGVLTLWPGLTLELWNRQLKKNQIRFIVTCKFQWIFFKVDISFYILLV